nr:NADH dehydrogenase subunit 5 [Amblyseius swirskii]
MMFFMLSFMFFMFFMFFMLLMFLTLMEEKVYILEWVFFDIFDIFDMKIYFYFDYMSNLFLSVVSLISAVVFLFSNYYMAGDLNKNKFMIFTFFFVISMFIVILSMNVFFILVGWDGLGLVSYFLVIHYNSDNSYYSGIITIMTNRLGDIGIIFMIFFMMSDISLDFLLFKFNSTFIYLLLLLFLASFSKSAQFPFSSWLPLAMAAPTPISALVHSSTLVTAGVYLFVRFESVFNNEGLFVMVFSFLSMFTIFMSGMAAMVEFDIKKVIAYSTMSQMSLMMMCVLLGNEILCFFHILTHAMFKSLMFLCSGVMIHESGNNQDIRSYLDFNKLNLFIVSIFLFSSLSLAGFPFLSGFYSKDLILEFIYSLNYNLFYIFILLFMTSITVSYSLRLMLMTIFISVNNMNFIVKYEWCKMNSSLFILYSGVVFLGSILNWLIMDKFTIIFFSQCMKSLTLFLLFLGVLVIFFFKNIMLGKFFISFFLNLMYLTKFQGYFLNNLINKMFYYYFYGEFYFNLLFVSKIWYLISNFNNLLSIFKFLSFLFMILVVIIFFFVI